MAGKRKRPNTPIGCELADGWVRMAQVQGDGDEAHVLADAVCVPQIGGETDHTAVREAIRALCRRNRFGTQQVVVALPDRLLWHRSVRVAVMPEGDLPNAVHFAIAREGQLGPESFTSAVVSVHRVQEMEKPKLEAIVYGATSAEVEQQANVLLRCGLEPIAAEPAPYAAIRAARRMVVADTDESSRAFALVRVGASRTTIFVVCDGIVRTIHGLSYGLDRAYSRAEAPENNTDSRSPERAEQQLRLELATLGRQIGQEASLLIQHQRRVHGGLHVPGLVLDTTAGDLLTDAIAMQCGLDVLPLTGLPVTSRSAEHDEMCGGAESWLACIGAAMASGDVERRAVA